jgi:hypothetical protein
MALNETTGIDPAVDRFVVKLLSTGQVINQNAVWPRADGGVAGINADWLYFKKVEQPQPPIDHRFTLDTVYGFTLMSPAPVTGLPVGTYSATYAPVKRELPELLAQIDTEFNRQVLLQFPQSDNPTRILLGLGILAKQQSGAALTSEETTLLSGGTATSDKVAQLLARKQELVDAATADQDYDLTVWPVL